MIKNKSITIFVLLFPLLSFLEAKIVRYKHFAETFRIDGGCGKIYTLNSYTFPKNRFGLGLHRFDLSITYGSTHNTEIGIKFNMQDLKNFFTEKQQINFISPYLKYHIINSLQGDPIDLSLGIYRTNIILIIEKLLPEIFQTSLTTNLYFSLTEEKKFLYSVAISKYTKWVEFIIDTNPTEELYAIGTKCLLTPKIKLSLLVVNLKNFTNLLFDNFIFGITIKT